MKITWRPSWDVEARKPAFINTEGSDFGFTPHGGQKYFWGNVPALDLLNLKQNEGVEVAEDLRLLFAGMCGIIRLCQSLTYL